MLTTETDFYEFLTQDPLKTIDYDQVVRGLTRLCVSPEMAKKVKERMTFLYVTNRDYDENMLLRYQSFRVVEGRDGQSLILKQYAIPARYRLVRDIEPYGETTLDYIAGKIVGFHNTRGPEFTTD